MNATGFDILPEDVLQCLLGHVEDQDRQAARVARAATAVTLCRLVSVCRVKVAPLVCKKWAKVLRQPSCAWDSIRIECQKLLKHSKTFSLLSWAQQRCSSTTTATLVTGADLMEHVVTAVLTKMPALKRLIYSPSPLGGSVPGRQVHMGPFGSLQPCPHLTHVYICILDLYQGHLDLLAHLQHLDVLVVRGTRQANSQHMHQDTFPGRLATLPSLRTLHITALQTGIHGVDDAISKLSRLEELHFIDCQITCVASGLLQLSQLRALQISNSCAYYEELVLPDLSLLPKLTNLAVCCNCEMLDLPLSLCNCMHLTSFAFESLDDEPLELPVGPYLRNLIEISVEVHHAKASFLKEAKQLQRLFCKGDFLQEQAESDLRNLALSVPNLREMHIFWEAAAGSRQYVQKCILLNQLLSESCNARQGVPVLHVDYEEDERSQLPWTVSPLLAWP